MAGTAVPIPEFEVTPLEAIPVKARAAREAFETNKTKDLEWRRVQLRKFYWALEDYKDRLQEALKHDLNKSYVETMITDFDWVQGDALWMLKHMDKLAKDEKLGVPDVPPTFAMTRVFIRKEPMGTVLIIGPYNFPLMLLLGPLASAIAAGCTAVLKPSDQVPATSMVLKEMIETRLDRDAFQVVNGAIPETNALLAEKWDKIFFTGSPAVGTIIAKKAAETLTPVCLELGGLNPAFVTKKANLPLAAKRLLYGKSLNAGQVCASQNYVLVERDVVETFVHHLQAHFKEMFPNGATACPDLVRLVNAQHFQRVKRLLGATKGKIVMGGQMDEANLVIEPTAVLVDSADDPILAEETFGPVFSIVPYDTLDQAIKIARGIHRTPLSLMSFGSKAENLQVLDGMTSGGATLNDAYLHASMNSLPFGGVGNSGCGTAHGRAGFDCFSHARTVVETPGWMERFLRVRYIPYSTSQYAMVRRLTHRTPAFDRDGRVLRGFGYWSALLLGLGAKNRSGALLRWVLALVGGFAAVLAYHGPK